MQAIVIISIISIYACQSDIPGITGVIQVGAFAIGSRVIAGGDVF